MYKSYLTNYQVNNKLKSCADSQVITIDNTVYFLYYKLYFTNCKVIIELKILLNILYSVHTSYIFAQ